VPNPSLIAGNWYQVVAVYDPGDFLDADAGVSIFLNGECKGGKCLIANPPYPSGGLYNSPGSNGWTIYPMNGGAPLRFGTRDCNTFFTGGLDEIAILDRILTASEIRQLYNAAR
jgi:hypothetical protein